VPRRHAIDIAVDALTMPAIMSFLSVGPLPVGLRCLLRIVAEGECRDATTAHVYKAPGAPLAEVREHRRLLIKWLHPDRNPEAIEHEKLARVIEAAEAIERGDQFGQATSACHSRPATTAKAGFVGENRLADARTEPAFRATAQAARQIASRVVSGFGRAAKRSVAYTALLVSILIAWRYVMEEPFGTSLTRYSKLALGVFAWP
jgi:hypothetical protein